MKTFFIKTAFFTIPFVFLYIITGLFYSSYESPDLIRLGCFPNVSSEYSNKFQNEFNRKIYFNKFSKTKKFKGKILTIGDSFSEQGSFGYKNYLAEKYPLLHIDKFISGNQIQTLFELSNGDFFEKQNIEYVILENVERNFVANAENIDPSRIIMTSQLDNIVSNQKPFKENNKDVFFSKKTIQFPFWMLRYYFDDNYLSNRYVYNVILKTNNLFSNNSNKLLFVYRDLSNLERNNDLIGVQKLNDVLNDLSNRLRCKKIKLIVLPAPDKYDLYYDYILDKTNFPKPFFFKHLASLEKNYTYIDSKKILSAQLESKKDIYFYDDTHWSPIASKSISDEIIKTIKNQ